MTSGETIDKDRLEAFSERVKSDIAGTLVTTLCVLGDRLGLFKDLAANGPATSDELAGRCSISERYAREWLAGMACAEYIDYDPAYGRFSMPPEHAPVLAEEPGPLFVGPAYHTFPPKWSLLEEIEEAFRTGGGVPLASYSPEMWAGQARRSNAYFREQLAQKWIPAADGLKEALELGADAADLGCGRGTAVLCMAQAFPESHFTGFDVHPPAVEEANRRAQAAGIADRARFEVLSAGSPLPGSYDLVTTFDVVHDLVDPKGALASIRAAIKPDGTYLMLEPRCYDRLEENIGQRGASGYANSVLYCMTASLGGGGAGLGTMGMPPSVVNRMCKEAGFSSVRDLDVAGPLQRLYEIRP